MSQHPTSVEYLSCTEHGGGQNTDMEPGVGPRGQERPRASRIQHKRQSKRAKEQAARKTRMKTALEKKASSEKSHGERGQRSKRAREQESKREKRHAKHFGPRQMCLPSHPRPVPVPSPSRPVIVPTHAHTQTHTHTPTHTHTQAHTHIRRLPPPQAEPSGASKASGAPPDIINGYSILITQRLLIHREDRFATAWIHKLRISLQKKKSRTLMLVRILANTQPCCLSTCPFRGRVKNGRADPTQKQGRRR